MLSTNVKLNYVSFFLLSDQISIIGTFEGHNDDHLTLLGQQDHSIFFGARDRVYNLSDVDLSENFVSIINSTIILIKNNLELSGSKKIV